MTDLLPLSYTFTFGKHREQTIEYVLERDMSYITWCIENLLSSPYHTLIESLKIYKDRSACKPLRGTLTDRIKQIVDGRNYREIMKTYNIEPSFVEKSMGLSESLNECIQSGNGIYPSGMGCFIDYLSRRILCEIAGIPFADDRASAVSLRTSDNIEKRDILFSIKQSYEICVDMQQTTSDIIGEIFNISWSHNIAFGDISITDMRKLKLYVNTQFTKMYVAEIMNMFLRFSPTSLQSNPVLGNKYISADCDVIFDSTLAEFKVAKYYKTIHTTLQLFGYVALANDVEINIDNVIVFEFYSNRILFAHISYWDQSHRNDFLTYLNNSKSMHDARLEEEEVKELEKIRVENERIKTAMISQRQTDVLFTSVLKGLNICYGVKNKKINKLYGTRELDVLAEKLYYGDRIPKADVTKYRISYDKYRTKFYDI